MWFSSPAAFRRRTLWALLLCALLGASVGATAAVAAAASADAAAGPVGESRAGIAVTSEQCLTARDAHQRLLESSFEVQREFRMSVNGNLKKREVSRLSYSNGALEIEVLEDEVLSKVMVFDGEGEDFALEFEFNCERLNDAGEGRYLLTSEDGIEVAEFVLDQELGALRPVAWRLDTTERFLFKKFVFEGRAEYSRFSWRTSPGGQQPASR